MSIGDFINLTIYLPNSPKNPFGLIFDVLVALAFLAAFLALSDKEALRTMSENLEKLARPDAAERIVDEIEKVMK